MYLCFEENFFEILSPQSLKSYIFSESENKGPLVGVCTIPVNSVSQNAKRHLPTFYVFPRIILH